MTWHIIEGPDDCGKTTLATGLTRRGWMYKHATAEDDLPRLAKRMHDIQEIEHVAWDRAHLGELVHGPLDRGTKPPMGWFNLIEAFLYERGVRATLLTVRYNEAENSRQRHETLKQFFLAAARLSMLHWHEGWPDLMPPMLDPYREEPEDWHKRTDPEGLGGNGNTLAWVLGEQQNPLAHIRWPFATRCGIELVWPMVNPRFIRVSNALRQGAKTWDAPELVRRWNLLNRPNIVTLGRVASQACKRAGIPVAVELLHPQHHIRFHHGEGEAYRRGLAQALSDLGGLYQC